jgi:uncharacterized Zn finger protein
MIVKIAGEQTPDEPARTPLQAAFDEQACEALAASPDVNLRGHTMVDDGLVEGLRIRPLGATGTVADGTPFYVALTAGDDGPGYSCTCDEGLAGLFCDHAVAVALVATGAIDPELGDHDPGYDEDEQDEDEDLDDEDEDEDGLRSRLAGMTHDELVDLVVDVAGTDRVLIDDLVANHTNHAGPFRR